MGQLIVLVHMISDTSTFCTSPPYSPSPFRRGGIDFLREAKPLFDSPSIKTNKKKA